MFEKQMDKLIDRVTHGSKKDRRIKELQDTLIHALSIIETYGHIGEYEANPDWTMPAYLREGEYTMEDRLKDVRRHGEKLVELEEDIRRVLFKHHYSD